MGKWNTVSGGIPRLGAKGTASPARPGKRKPMVSSPAGPKAARPGGSQKSPKSAGTKPMVARPGGNQKAG